MTKPYAFSYSAIKDFRGCARRYHACKVLKLHPFVDTDATIYGKVVHTACEEYIRDGKPLASGLGHFQPMLDKLISMPGDKYCELKMAVDARLKPVEFLAKDVWVRGIIDLLIVNGGTAYVVDYKTGKAKYPDKDQLELMAMLVFEHYPEVNEIKGALIFMSHNVLVKAVYKRDNRVKLWRKWKERSVVLDTCFETNVWHPTPSPLCGWCPVESCNHHVRR